MMASIMGAVKVSSKRIVEFSTSWWVWLAFTGTMLACCISVKFVGLFVVLLIGFMTIADLWEVLGDMTRPVVSLYYIHNIILGGLSTFIMNHSYISLFSEWKLKTTPSLQCLIQYFTNKHLFEKLLKGRRSLKLKNYFFLRTKQYFLIYIRIGKITHFNRIVERQEDSYKSILAYPNNVFNAAGHSLQHISPNVLKQKVSG